MINERDKELLEYFAQTASKFDIELTESEISKFFEYKDLLISWNEKINLTAITEDKQIILKHFIDSLTILPYVEKGVTVIDVGTGAGFPGIPLKIVRPDITLTLLDSLKKRLNFLQDVLDKLEISNASLVHTRAEDGGMSALYRESFDIATARAVAPLAVLCELCLPFVKIGGIFIAMKGDAAKEIIQGERAIKILGGKIKGLDKFYLDGNENLRNVIVIEKVKATPAMYPRKPGMLSKEPIDAILKGYKPRKHN